jgi:potassium-transporting ATPase KdpC subunit
MRSEFRPAIVLLILFTLLTGVAYPLAVTGIAQLALPAPADGSWLRRGNTIVGSKLIGQPFDDPRYFWGRLSATSPFPYNPELSTGSNFGPMSPALLDASRGRIQALRIADSTATAPVPVDLATASGSGLDPEISPAAAEYQVRRVARSRAMSEQRVRDLVRQFTAGRTLGILGEARVNVLELNLALDEEGARR